MTLEIMRSTSVFIPMITRHRWQNTSRWAASALRIHSSVFISSRIRTATGWKSSRSARRVPYPHKRDRTRSRCEIRIVDGNGGRERFRDFFAAQLAVRRHRDIEDDIGMGRTGDQTQIMKVDDTVQSRDRLAENLFERQLGSDH